MIQRAASPEPTPRRMRLLVHGAVQGVGFRPYVFELAERFGLGGFVANDPHGVLIEVEGPRTAEFVGAFGKDAPPLARIERVHTEETLRREERQFRILPSTSGPITTRIVPDAVACERCLDELFDPASRFHLYPFVNCTHCGPRYTISRRLPYDRPTTAMAPFSMCVECSRDYADPRNRRFHAEAVACSRCGPRLSHSIGEVVDALRSGKIVALKGLGGFQLLCDARNDEAVRRLRQRKGRDAKPFAVMVASPASLDTVAIANPAEVALLTSVEAPIVLLESRGALAPSIAPRLSRLGVMLPCTPLHHLIFHAAAGAPAGNAWRDHAVALVIVATSANPGGEPLIVDNEDARERLGEIAELVVTHDRAIVIRADDSLVQIVDGAPALIRRARGFVPRPILLQREVVPGLALGGHLKTTITVTRGCEAFVSQHIGDLDDVESIRFLKETVAHLLATLDVRPEFVACDRHPDFATTHFAEQLTDAYGGCDIIDVQHHHAHIGAVAAENGIDEPVLGLALDGYGFGEHGANWGGELLVCEGANFRRIGHLAPIWLPGGDIAAREPWRMAAGVLHDIGRGHEVAGRFPEQIHARKLSMLLDRGDALKTTSAGRLFDAAAGLLGTCQTQAYEGQAAMELEALVRTPRVDRGGWLIDGGVISFEPLLRRLAAMRLDPVEGAELLHGTLAAGLVDLVARMSAALGIKRVALGGGCFLNRTLTEAMLAGLRASGMVPLIARQIPPNDGGLSLGQAWVASQIFSSRPHG